MTERINTTSDSVTGSSFSPSGDFTVQASIDSRSRAKVIVEAQADAAADWVEIGTISALTKPPMLRFAKAPFVRVRSVNNNDSYTLKVWSGE